jgi:hypothetical protein
MSYKKDKSVDEIIDKMKSANEEEFLEFKEDFKEKDRVKLRENPLGEPPSYREIERYLRVKNRLKKLLIEKNEQQGLIYRLHLKRKNNNIDEEIQQTGDEYSQLLVEIKRKTGYSNEEIEEFIEGGRCKKIENYIARLKKENEEMIEEQSPGKNQLFYILKSISKEKKVQPLIGIALIGTSIIAPPSGFISMIIFGLHPGFLPFTLGSAAKAIKAAGGVFLLKGALKERKEIGLKTVKVSFDTKEELIEDASEEEIELRNTKIEMPENKVEPVIEKPIEEIVQKEEPIILEIKEPVIEKSKPEKKTPRPPVEVFAKKYKPVKIGREELLEKVGVEKDFIPKKEEPVVVETQKSVLEVPKTEEKPLIQEQPSKEEPVVEASKIEKEPIVIEKPEPKKDKLEIKFSFKTGNEEKQEDISQEELELMNTKIEMPETEVKPEEVVKQIFPDNSVKDKFEEAKEIIVEDFGAPVKEKTEEVERVNVEKINTKPKEKTEEEKREDLFIKLGGEKPIRKEESNIIVDKNKEKEGKSFENTFERPEFIDSKEMEEELLTGKPKKE